MPTPEHANAASRAPGRQDEVDPVHKWPVSHRLCNIVFIITATLTAVGICAELAYQPFPNMPITLLALSAATFAVVFTLLRVGHHNRRCYTTHMAMQTATMVAEQQQTRALIDDKVLPRIAAVKHILAAHDNAVAGQQAGIYQALAGISNRLTQPSHQRVYMGSARVHSTADEDTRDLEAWRPSVIDGGSVSNVLRLPNSRSFDLGRAFERRKLGLPPEESETGTEWNRR